MILLQIHIMREQNKKKYHASSVDYEKKLTLRILPLTYSKNESMPVNVSMTVIKK